tara:strand:- start:12867 stop:21989 length:9123 start_codon:yes stop_codon:yes gene_type:complete
MPKIKHNFVQGKMNKDLDERLVPNGQYRDALNIQVSTSEDSEIGTIQNILGNSLVPGQDFIHDNATCVGSIADEKNDKLYWFISNGTGPELNSDRYFQTGDHLASGGIWQRASNMTTTFDSNGVTIVTDGSTGGTYGTFNLRGVNPIELVDKQLYKVEVKFFGIDNAGDTHTPGMTWWVGGLGDSGGHSGYRPTNSGGLHPNATNGVHVVYFRMDKSQNKAGGVGSGTTNMHFRFQMTNGNSYAKTMGIEYASIKRVGSSVIAEYDTVKNLVTPVFVDEDNTTLDFRSDSLITGINIIDDMLFWTDGHSEPKKINISRSIQGTDTRGVENTQLINHTQTSASDGMVGKAREEHVTVIKKPPLNSLKLDLNLISERDPSKTWSGIMSIAANPGSPSSIFGSSQGIVPNFNLLNIGDTFKTFIISDINNSNNFELNWKPGDTVVLKGFDTAQIPPTTPIQNYEIKGTITDWPFNQFTNNVTEFIGPDLLNGSFANGSGSTADDWLGTGTNWKWNSTHKNIESDPPPASGGGPGGMHAQLSIILPNIEEGQTWRLTYDVGPPNDGTTPLEGRLWVSMHPNGNQLQHVAGRAMFNDQQATVGYKEHIFTIDSSDPAFDPSTGWNSSSLGNRLVFHRKQYTPSGGTEGWFNGTIDNVNLQLVDTTQAQVEIKINSIIGDKPEVLVGNTRKFVMDLYDNDNSLFKFKFPRFSYRYRYLDGEYSVFAPFSNVAFSAGLFSYDPSQAYNLGMQNNVKSIILSGLENDLPQDVESIDILYKEEVSPNIYIVDTISATMADKPYIITQESVQNGVLPSNQLLRPWDNVPKKALAQEISGNRIIYGNYTQNYDLVDSNGNKYFIDINTDITSKVNNTLKGTRSIKSLRDYQVGVVYADEYGRQTPILTSDASANYIPKEQSGTLNSFQVRIASEGTPANMKYFKFFIKDNSGEYYNMVMDRFYKAGANTVWLSFPSSDRNKVDVDDFIILKKGMASDTATTGSEKYKIIDIKNEAPDSIAVTESLLLSRMHDDTAGLNSDLFNDSNNLPADNRKTFEIAFNQIQYNALANIEEAFLNRDTATDWFAEIANTSLGRTTEKHKIVAVKKEGTNSVHFTLHKGWDDAEDGINEFTDDPSGANVTKIINGTILNIYRVEPSISNLFKGRFFVKVKSDAMSVVSPAITTVNTEWITIESRKIYSLATNPSGANNIWFPQRSLNMPNVYVGGGLNQGNPSEDNGFFHGVPDRNDSLALNSAVAKGANVLDRTWAGWWASMIRTGVFFGTLNQRIRNNTPVVTPNTTNIPNITHTVAPNRYEQIFLDYDAYFRGINVAVGNGQIDNRIDGNFDIHTSGGGGGHAYGQSFEDVWFIDSGTSPGMHPHTPGPGNPQQWGTNMNLDGLNISPVGYIGNTLEIGFGGIQPPEWPTDHTFTGVYENGIFYDIQVGNTNYASTQAGFVDKIAVGSQFKFKEDPTETIYTITNVEIFHRIRYETLLKQHLGEVLAGGPFTQGSISDDIQYGSLTTNQMFKYQLASLNGSGTGPAGLINSIGHAWDNANKGATGIKPNWDGREAPGVTWNTPTNIIHSHPQTWVSQYPDYLHSSPQTGGANPSHTGVNWGTNPWGGGPVSTHHWHWFAPTGVYGQISGGMDTNPELPRVLETHFPEASGSGTTYSQSWTSTQSTTSGVNWGSTFGMNNQTITQSLTQTGSANANLYSQSGEPVHYKPTTFFRPSNFTKNFKLTLDRQLAWDPVTWQGYNKIPGAKEVQLTSTSAGRPSAPYNYVDVNSLTDSSGGSTDGNVLTVGMVLYKYASTSIDSDELAIVSKITDLGSGYRLHFKKYGGGPAFASADSSGNIPHIDASQTLYFAQFPMNALSKNAAKNLNYFRDGVGFGSPQAGTDAVGYTIEFIESVSTYFTDDETLPPNPAIWETEPKKQTTDIDIYYEASSFYPVKLSMEVIDGSVSVQNSTMGPIDVTIDHINTETGYVKLSEKVLIDGAMVGYTQSLSAQTTSTLYETDHFVNIGDRLRIGLKNGSYAMVEITNIGALDSNGKTDVFYVNTDLHNAEFELNWFNCFSFGNGVESNRISDVFNKQFITPGVKVSTVFDRYQEEERKYGLIYSGLYNSNSGINNLNQFIQAEKITKDVNPSYGSIQKLHSRDTDLVTLCEDKVLRILANKDAVFNADGNPQLVATQNVLGQTIPFVGEYGISKNPESFVSEAYRSYFTDKQRGTVMRLSRDGLTPISDHGMSDWFKDNLSNSQTNLLGNPFTPTVIQNLMIPGFNHDVRAPIYEEDIITFGSINEAAWETGDYSHNNFAKFPYLLKEKILEVGKKYRLQFDVVEVGGGAEWMVSETGDNLPPAISINKTYGNGWSGVKIPGTRKTGHVSVEWVSDTENLFLGVTQVNPVAGYFDGSNTQTTTVQEYIGNLKGDTNCVSVVNGGDASGCTIGNWNWFYGGVTKIKNLILEEVKEKTNLIGSWDDKKNEYNLTIHSDDPKTISFKENVTGWTSFKSFIPENAISCANDYYTFKDGKIWQHHIEGPGRNTFYGVKYPSNFTVLLNDFPNIVKSFHAIDYEGSQANIVGIKTITAEKIEPTYPHTWAIGVNSGKYIWDFDMDTMMDLLGIDSWEANNPSYYDIRIKQYRNNILVAHGDMRVYNNAHGVHIMRLGSQKGGDFQIGDIITTEDQEKSVSALNSMPKTGWYASNITTDMQEGTIPEFVNKENKWFNYIKGKELTSETEGGSKLNSLTDFGAFNIQGVGVAYSVNEARDRIYFMDREYVNISLQLGDTLYFVPASKKGVGNSLSPVWNWVSWNEGWIKHNPALTVSQEGSSVKILSDSATVTSSTPIVYSNYFSLEDGKQYRLEVNVRQYDNGGDTGSGDFIKIYLEGKVSGVSDRQILTNAVTGFEGKYHETTLGKHFLDFTYDKSINNDENDVRIQIELNNGHVTTKYVTIKSITLKELNIGDSFGFDRVNSSDIQRIGEVTMITSSNTSDTNSIQVDKTSGTMPSPLDYIMFAKNQVINTSSLLGYYASVKFENNSQEKIELFSVNSEITESSK